MDTLTTTLVWDEPDGCASPRGWLRSDGTPVGFYLDYGDGNRRHEHETLEPPRYGWQTEGRLVVWCREDNLCRTCQPGNILAVAYPDGPRTPSVSRWVQNIDQARFFIERGGAALGGLCCAPDMCPTCFDHGGHRALAG